MSKRYPLVWVQVWQFSERGPTVSIRRRNREQYHQFNIADMSERAWNTLADALDNMIPDVEITDILLVTYRPRRRQ